MKLNRIMIAAPKSGSGKTTVTCGLLQALKDKGEKVVSYKCGPDYIDPMFHRRVITIPAKNLDTFFTTKEDTIRLLLSGRSEDEFAILEGVMGLFDGLGGVRPEGSSYHLAQITKTPIVLVLDAKGMGKSMLAVIAGFLQYDTDHLIKGVLLNRISESYFEIMKPLIQSELGVQVVGYLPQQDIFQMESRHLGLKLPNEMEKIRTQLENLSAKIRETVSLEQILELGKSACTLDIPKAAGKNLNGSFQAEYRTKEKPVLAVARDEAFCFYYEDNLELLSQLGVEIRYFSPIHDKTLPKGTDGLLLGGGYPELWADKLSENQQMREEIHSRIAEGIPAVAECGGFLYLHEKLIDDCGREYPMVGSVAGDCFYTKKLVRFGYIEIQERESSFLPRGERIRGHEFHYFDSTNNGERCSAIKPVTGKQYSCINGIENQWFGFPHLYFPSNPKFAKAFVKKIYEYNLKKQRG